MRATVHSASCHHHHPCGPFHSSGESSVDQTGHGTLHMHALVELSKETCEVGIRPYDCYRCRSHDYHRPLDR